MSREAILAIATAARAFLEPVWHDWHSARSSKPPAVASENTCGRSSLFLQRALVHSGFAAGWVTGVPSPDGSDDAVGFFDGRIWRSHAWVECEGLIVDLTADQFGCEPVMVCPIEDTRYRKGTGDAASPSFVSARAQAVATIWPFWIAARK